ncbi:MAG: YbaN family protein [Acidovorax sp.]|jgi:uncharacterized membrane protein YbaN (DUF454 family)|uniref:YbaN family protein n=1 Tax=Acidovorax sp. TaxID=1872122 RepID=UPI00260BD3DE|nr:YbaN family protein [Acidovorax sp.]MDH4463199.1 YbaN family protein [Acidovorax sp.]
MVKPDEPSNTSGSMPVPRPLPWVLRWVLHAFAVLCLGLAVVGVIVPGMPTTVFVLMAAWAAARSSPRLYRWLWNHRLLGPPLRNWTQGGTVSRRAKWSATVVMGLSSVILWAAASQTWVWVGAIGCMACVLAWLWRRPEPH